VIPRQRVRLCALSAFWIGRERIRLLLYSLSTEEHTPTGSVFFPQAGSGTVKCGKPGASWGEGGTSSSSSPQNSDEWKSTHTGSASRAVPTARRYVALDELPAFNGNA
jgi:hypothetical protein